MKYKTSANIFIVFHLGRSLKKKKKEEKKRPTFFIKNFRCGSTKIFYIVMRISSWFITNNIKICKEMVVMCIPQQALEQLSLPRQSLQPREGFGSWMQFCKSHTAGSAWGLSVWGWETASVGGVLMLKRCVTKWRSCMKSAGCKILERIRKGETRPFQKHKIFKSSRCQLQWRQRIRLTQKSSKCKHLGMWRKEAGDFCHSKNDPPEGLQL